MKLELRHAFLAAAMLVLSACASDRQVYVDLPISRLELPEPGPRAFDAGPALIDSARMELTPDQTQSAPDTKNPRFDSGESGPQVKVEGSPARWLTLGAKGNNSGWWGGQLKLMPFEAGLRDTPVSFALTGSVLTGSHRFDYDSSCFFSCSSPDVHTHVKGVLHDYAAILGLRMSPVVMLYGGAYTSGLGYSGDYSYADNSTTVQTTFSDHARSRGGNIGLAFTLGGWGRLLAEYSQASLHAGFTRDSVGVGGVSLEAFFGPRWDSSSAPPRRTSRETTPRETTPGETLAPETKAGHYVSAQALVPFQPGDAPSLRAGAGLRPRPTTSAPILADTAGVTSVVLRSSVRNAEGTWWYVKAGDEPGWVLEADLVAR